MQYAARKGRVAVQDSEGYRRLPIGPFRALLVDLLMREHAGVEVELADRLGVPARLLWGWLRTNTYVSLDAADRVLCVVGEPTMLAEFWPFLYEFDTKMVAA